MQSLDVQILLNASNLAQLQGLIDIDFYICTGKWDLVVLPATASQVPRTT